MPNNSSLPAALVITKAAILQSTTQIPIRSTLCHQVPQSWRPRLPQPMHTPLVTMKQPREKSLAHSALPQLQAKPARPHSTPVSLPPAFSGPIIFQTGFPGEHDVSWAWTLCAYGNIPCIVYHSLCILNPLAEGVWSLSVSGETERFLYVKCVYE